MCKLIGIALLIMGIVLIVLGMDASDSVGSDFSRLLSGPPTTKAIWLLVGGIVSVFVGGTLSLRPARH